MSAMGIKIEQFDITVCNSFKAKILNNQLCYEVDLNEFSDHKNIEKELKIGFNFLMDYNEDRQVLYHKNAEKGTLGLAGSVVASDQEQQASIQLNTIGG